MGSFTFDKDNILINGNRVYKTLRVNHLKAQFSNRFGKKIKLNYGIEYNNKNYSLEYISSIDSIFQNFDNNTVTFHAEGEFYTSNKIVYRAGLRTEYASHLNKFYIAPRLSMAYKFSNTAQISFAYGMFYQNPIDDYILYS